MKKELDQFDKMLYGIVSHYVKQGLTKEHLLSVVATCYNIAEKHKDE